MISSIIEKHDSRRRSSEAVPPSQWTDEALLERYQETADRRCFNGDQFFFLTSREGDGTVPLMLAELEDVTTYYAEEEHGSLPNNREVNRWTLRIRDFGRN